ncbi:MAG: helix-turn-helix domain-containing protein, partial [Bacteroidales bacterium]|nr:helix-turn-helix domain-containing protein [Bacteroidales bacterium]
PHSLECLWTFCSLSAYPIYYIYICLITSQPQKWWHPFCLLLPGILIAAGRLFSPEGYYDEIQKVFFALQIVCTAYFGIRKLQQFDHKLAHVYADTVGRDTTAVKHLLIAIVVISIWAFVANVLGRRFFAQSDWLLLFISLSFSALQFALGYIGYNRKFTIEEFVADIKEGDEADAQTEDIELPSEELEQKLFTLMVKEQYYLTKNLKINDVALRVQVCRTYLSAHINHHHNCNFSEYVNDLRVEHAKRLMLATAECKMYIVARESGYSTEQAFYRNFQKKTGMKPSEWLAERQKAQ